MSEPLDDDSERRETKAAFDKADRTCTFGPSFFLSHLGRFVRDHCPAPDEHLPTVQIRLLDGQTLNLCHIIGISPRWVILAIRDPGNHQNEMAIDFVPFEMVQGVRIRTRHAGAASVGFAQVQSPVIISAETLVEAALTPRPGSTA